MVYSTAAAACLMSPFLSSCSFATHLFQALQMEHDDGVVGLFLPLLQGAYQVLLLTVLSLPMSLSYIRATLRPGKNKVLHGLHQLALCAARCLHCSQGRCSGAPHSA